MNITKVIAEEVAENMVLPILSKIKKLNEERTNLANAAISKSIPKDLSECYKKHSSYFTQASSATLHCGRHEVRVEGVERFPAVTSWNPLVQVDGETIEKVEKIRLEIEEMDDEKRKMVKSITSSLLSLRTFKRAKENFPEAYKYMEQYEKGKTEIALPIKEILSTIGKYDNSK